MDKAKPATGRPPGREYAHIKTLRLRAEDVERLRDLAQEWGCSEAAVVRRLLAEASKGAKD